jgi:mitochondrial cardiolipin hydrolase
MLALARPRIIDVPSGVQKPLARRKIRAGEGDCGAGGKGLQRCLIMNEESRRVLSLFEEASREGWVSPPELQVIRQEIEAKGLAPERMDWLRGQVMQVLHRKAQDKESRRLAGWVESVMRLVETRAGREQSSRVYFTPGGDCHEAVAGCLDAARSSLDICVFTITDDRITDRIRQAGKRGVRIRIITDDEKAWDTGSDVYLLAAAGLQVRQDFSPDHMHHKFAVMDDRQVITGSFNWTRGSSNNYENILICGELQVVSAYHEEFDRLWNIMDPVRTAVP